MKVPESRSEFHPFSVTIALQKDGKLSGQIHPLVESAMHWAFIAAVIAVLLMIIALITKLLWNCDGEENESGEAAATARVTEQSRLLQPKEDAMHTTYGTTWNNDLESGSTSSSEDLYDGKICVICYEGQRNCFFIPCGHCVACHTCAARIMKEESNKCPICRGIIDKVRKLHVL